MRQPGRHWVVALFFEGPAAWQTRPRQHCESLRHFDCGSGPACLQLSAPALGTATASTKRATGSSARIWTTSVPGDPAAERRGRETPTAAGPPSREARYEVGC